MNFFNELKQRNKLLYWFGWCNLLAGMICLILVFVDDQQILGINRWIKPLKFFMSVSIMVWTMGWIMYYLDNKKAVKRCSWLIVLSMFIENFLITLQSARGTTSHYNSTSSLNAVLFSILGIFILVFTITAIRIAWLFFKQKTFSISSSYLWGILLGLILFIIFTSEGGMMVQRLSHTVGGPDGGPGMPLVNWSTRYGDLRIAHFLGMHALQKVPLAGFYVLRRKQQVILFAIIYFVVVSVLFALALLGRPLIGI
jgi:hypothetical protein